MNHIAYFISINLCKKGIVMKVHINKIIIQVAAILVLILVLPLGQEQFLGNYSYLSGIKYILAVIIAIPTIIYAIKEYRKTAKRLYLFPCFVVALGFWVASMFFMQQKLPDSLYQKNPPIMVKEDNELNENKLISNEKYFHLTHGFNNKYNKAGLLFFDKELRLKSDTTLLVVYR